MENPLPPRSVLHSKNLEDLHATSYEIFFPGQRSGEKCWMVIRSHVIAEIKIFLELFAFGIGIPFVFYMFFSLFDANTFTHNPVIGLIASGYLLAAWMYFFIEYQKNDLTVIIVSSERVVEINRDGLFSNSVNETTLSRIQEVNGHLTGMISSALDVGEIIIKTAGMDVPIHMKNVKHPHLTARRITDIAKHGTTRRRASDSTPEKLSHRSGEKISDEEIKKLRNYRSREGENLSPEELTRLRKSSQVIQESENHNSRREDETGVS